MTLCTLRAATVLSRDCRADFGRRLTKKVMSHSRDGPGVTAPSRTNIVPLTGVWNPPLPLPPLKTSPMFFRRLTQNNGDGEPEHGLFSATNKFVLMCFLSLRKKEFQRSLSPMLLQSIAIRMGRILSDKLVVHIVLSAKRRACCRKSTAIEMGGVSRYLCRNIGVRGRFESPVPLATCVCVESACCLGG